MKKIISALVASFVLALLVVPLAAGAIETPPTGKDLPAAPVSTGAGLLDKVDLASNWLFAIFVTLSIIYLLLAAFQFVTAGGDAAKVSEARQKLIYAVMGIVIALLVRGLPTVLRNIIV